MASSKQKNRQPPLCWQPAGQFIAGEWRKGKGTLRSICSPSGGAELCRIADASAEDLDYAVRAAERVRQDWTDCGPVVRGRILKEAANRLRAHADELALMDALDCGNPIRGMRFDVTLGTALLEYFAGLATELKGETLPRTGGKLTYVMREPLGIVARLVPFNHPFMFAAAKIAAPLAAGNAVILKPSEETPMSALRMAEIIGDLFPKGLLSVLTGDAELGSAIIKDGRIAAIGLIGSVATGREVLRQGAASLKRTQLELGGKNALVICADADIKKAVSGAVKGMNLNWTGGQSCGSTSRLLIHESHYDTVVREVGKAFDGIRLGDPVDEKTEMGCLSTRAQYEKTRGFIERALAAGAKSATKNEDTGDMKGFFVRPTLLYDVPATAEIAREEIFGPVLTALKWKTHKQMLEIVNGLDVGLTASIWTRNLEEAMTLSEKIRAGYIWINDASDHYLGAPFGGMKQSGIGREECMEEMYAYTDAKSVTVVTDASASQ